MATWRKKITLDHACSANTDQADFPFLIALEDPACTSLATDRLYTSPILTLTTPSP